MLNPAAIIAIAYAWTTWTSAEWQAFGYTVAGAAAGILLVAGILAGSVVKLVRMGVKTWAEIKAELAKNRAAVTSLETATNGNLKEQIKTVAEEVRTATLANALNDSPLPTTPEQLEDFIRSVVDAARGTKLADERRELDLRRERLAAFLGSEQFPTLPAVEQGLLRQQVAAMASYSTALGERIAVAMPAA